MLFITGYAVRLVNGNNTAEGRVEIYYEQSWATVCNDRWGDDDASVICRQLGLSSTGQAAKFDHGNGTILLSNVTCVNNESNIFNCSHNGFENHDCNHDKDAGVRCHNVTHQYSGKVSLSTLCRTTCSQSKLLLYTL